MAVPNVITMKTLYQGYIDAGFALCVINEGKGPKARVERTPPCRL